MKIVLFLMSLILSSSIYAKDFGVQGEVWPIQEKDFLVFIHKKLAVMQANGEWIRMQDDFKKRVKQHLTRPTPTILPRATENRIHYFDPSFVTSRNIEDIKGNILITKGTRINPLDKASLRSTLYFFNGDDAIQIKWIQEELKNNKHCKLILTQGSLKDATGIFKQAVYFDLYGVLTRKLHIQALPAKVQQSDKKLEILEVAL